MVFKQGVCKEEKVKFCLVQAIMLSLPLAMAVILLVKGEHTLQNLIVLFLLFLPIILVSLVLGLDSQERFYVYTDRIEVKSVFRRKNVVYYKEVEYIEEVEILLTSRDMPKQFYIFHDGRKNNGNLLNLNSCYNKKKYNLRIYKTPELENFITKTLCIEIRKQLP